VPLGLPAESMERLLSTNALDTYRLGG